MTTSDRKGSFTVMAPILVVYMAAFAAIVDTSKDNPAAACATPKITIPAECHDHD